MNKQELEKQAEALYTDVRSFLDNTFELIDQIHEPQKIVVPKFVAEWIEYCKKMNYSLRDAMKNIKLSVELNAWFLKTGQGIFEYPNQETFARAWLDCYEVEQEKLYTVEIPDPNSYCDYRYLSRNDNGICLGASNDTEWKQKKRNQFTESEIKQDFEWAWDAGFAKEV